GWTAWVDDRQMLKGMLDKHRPFCRGRSGPGGGPWFPRTSKRPSELERWAVFSRAGQLPHLERDGWFLASRYVLRPAAFVPPTTQECGVLDAQTVSDLHAKLQGFFWDSRTFRAERR